MQAQVKKRKHVSHACRNCRHLRAKCDAMTPCSPCFRRGKECIYDVVSDGRRKEARWQRLENQLAARLARFPDGTERPHPNGSLQHDSTPRELLRLLRDASDHEASAVLARIREGFDPEVILRQAGAGDLLTQHNLRTRTTAHQELIELLTSLSDEDAIRILRSVRARIDVATIVNQVKAGNLLVQMALQPETRYRYEFPYRTRMPEEYLPNNPYLDSLIYEVSSLYSPSDRSASIPVSRVTNLSSYAHQDVYLKPFHAAEVVDSLLSEAKISLWTCVCDDDVLMRDLLRGWLRCEYHFTAAFQKNLFLEDMVSQRKDFCSSLLVNVVLGYSCICYPSFSNRAEYWNPHTLTYRFIAEAKRLWELEVKKPRITTIQAGILLNVFYNLCGLDEVGQPYRIQAIALAHEMRLFESAAGVGSERTRRGRAFSAWALFNWETLVGFSFMFNPLLRSPPDWQLPDPVIEADWYGEIWVRYPSSDHLIPSYFGQVFRARSQFRVVMNRVCQALYTDGTRITLDKANELLLQLRLWYDMLPGALLPKAIVLPGQLQLHMYYHHLIMTIFEPLINTDARQEPFLQSIITDARKHLETLIRLYYLRHGYEAMDLFIVIPLMLTAFNCLEAMDEQTPAPKLEVLRSTLILVTKGLYNQRRNHYLAEALFRVVKGRMRPPEIGLFSGIMAIDEDEPRTQASMSQAVRSHWPVAVVKRKEDLDFHILTNLVANFAHVNTEDHV